MCMRVGEWQLGAIKILRSSNTAELKKVNVAAAFTEKAKNRSDSTYVAQGTQPRQASRDIYPALCVVQGTCATHTNTKVEAGEGGGHRARAESIANVLRCVTNPPLQVQQASIL